MLPSLPTLGVQPLKNPLAQVQGPASLLRESEPATSPSSGQCCWLDAGHQEESSVVVQLRGLNRNGFLHRVPFQEVSGTTRAKYPTISECRRLRVVGGSMSAVVGQYSAEP